eukprot:TRINITY_DN14583_c0_g1_i1.p1 TRINITY_DN14583_c0_g1~~TRINITY_DN14583_c0_g1_i1.p1  ORF type:complete len:288 (+),score=69.30 TRINITY_DN14583_c0_g1_i1:343-1206(+)
MPGIWRAMDGASGGFVSINEIDQDAADTLLNFKQWAEDRFGTIKRMFCVFDRGSTGKVSYPLFRRNLTNYGYKGDAYSLFQSLKPDASGKGAKKSQSSKELTLRDMSYLSTWEYEGNSGLLGENEEDEDGAAPVEARAPGDLRRLSKGAVFNKRESASSPSPKLSARHQSRPKPTPDKMTYCRSQKDYDYFKEVQKLPDLALQNTGLLSATLVNFLRAKQKSNDHAREAAKGSAVARSCSLPSLNQIYGAQEFRDPLRPRQGNTKLSSMPPSPSRKGSMSLPALPSG